MRLKLNILIFLLLIRIVVYSQYSITVEFADKKLKNSSIGSFELRGILYASVNDFCNLFGYHTFYNAESQKLEVKINNHKIKFTANNYFVIVTDEKGELGVIQLENKTVFASYSFFIPIKKLVNLFSNVTGQSIQYDVKRNKIDVGIFYEKKKYDIFGIMYDVKVNGTMIRLMSNKRLKDYDSWVRYEPDDKDKKNGWLYLTIADAKADVEKLKSVKPAGIVKELLMFPSANSVQFTFKLNQKISNTEILQDSERNDLILAIYTPLEEKLPEKELKPYEKNIIREKERWKLDVVVIDPGHGGKDPGAIGVTGTKEKDITLAVAKKLGKLIEMRMPDVKVVYTRQSDEFVELYRRGQIANQANGKLFISLHCNSTSRKPSSAKGFEIYLLRPGKTEHALKIAERENSVIQFESDYEKRYQELTEENFILLTMAQSAYMKYSEHFAELSSNFVQKHTDLEINGVKQAGFYVLIGASMPNVLVEMGYISNREDEKFLKSEKGQNKIAEALFHAIQRYKIDYDQSIEGLKQIGAKE